MQKSREAAIRPRTAREMREYKVVQKDIEGAEELMRGADVEMRELATEELEPWCRSAMRSSPSFGVLLVPKDPNDEKNVILEIRAGTGGEEAALFAGDLFRMSAALPSVKAGSSR